MQRAGQPPPWQRGATSVTLNALGGDMNRAALRHSWQETLGPGVDLPTLDPGATYPLHCQDPPGLPPTGTGYVAQAEIGRGGSGIVQRARQVCLDRLVALKTLAHGQTDDRNRARAHFVAEALVNGRLEHPNIVPVYDLGSAGDGEPYMAMKLIAGETWRSRLEARPDALAEHLQILVQVCNATAYAHSRGIIHNDLKPDNVMLGAFGEVLVVDWGLAVTFEAPEAGSGVRHKSSIRNFCGTPSYMPPELALGRGDALGPPTDIYLLGGLLCRILRGTPPHEADGFVQTMVHAAQGKLPELPDDVPATLASTCLKALQPDPAERHSSAQAFKQELQVFLQHQESLRISGRAAERLAACRGGGAGDLLAEAERNRLYQGFAAAVAGFEQALELWADNAAAREGQGEARLAYARAALAQGDLGLAETQVAGLPSDLAAGRMLATAIQVAQRARLRARRGRRWLQRVVVAHVVLVLGGLSWGLWTLDAKNHRIAAEKQTTELERSRAQQAESTAVLEREHAEELVRFMLGDLEEKLSAVGRLDLLKAVALKATAFYRREAVLDDPESRFLNLRALLQLGEVLMDEGVIDEAERAYTSARALAEHLQAGADSVAGWDMLAIVHSRLGDVARDRGELPAALQSYTLALQLAERVVADSPLVRPLVQLSVAHAQVGHVLQEQGRIGQAMGHYSAGRGIAERAVALGPPSIDARRQLAACHALLGRALSEQGDLPAALVELRAAARINQDLLATEPERAQVSDDIVMVSSTIGAVLQRQGRHDEALEAYLTGLEMSSRLTTLEPSHVHWLSNHTLILGSVAAVYRDLERWEEAERCYLEAVKLYPRLDSLDSLNSRRNRWDRMVMLVMYAEMLGDMGRHEDAIVQLRRGIEAAGRLPPERQAGFDFQRELAIFHARLAKHLQSSRALDEAASTYEQALLVLEGPLQADSTQVQWQLDAWRIHRDLRPVLRELMRLPEALVHCEAELALSASLQRQAPELENWTLLRADAMVQRAELCSASAGEATALVAWGEAFEFLQASGAAVSEDPPLVQLYLQATHFWGVKLEKTEKLEPALQCFVQMRALASRMKDQRPTEDVWGHWLRDSWHWIGVVQRELGQLQEAADAIHAALDLAEPLAHMADVDAHLHMAKMHYQLAQILRDLGLPEASREAYETSLAIVELQAEQHPQSPSVQPLLDAIQSNPP